MPQDPRQRDGCRFTAQNITAAQEKNPFAKISDIVYELLEKAIFSSAIPPGSRLNIAKSMKVSQAEQKLAVECGYWPLFRYCPELAAEGKNPFQLDSKAPNGKLREFMMGEVRFSGLTRTFPQIAEQLFAEAEEQCAARYAQYEKLAAQK